MSAKDHWDCSIEQHPRYRLGEHGIKIGCSVAAGHNLTVGPRDCYTCKQAARREKRGVAEPKQQADKLHFACALMPWEHDPPNLVGSMGGHREGCAVLPGHTATPGRQCPACRRRYAGHDGLSPAEFADHPHYDCLVPLLDHPIKQRVGRGHRPGCSVAVGHKDGGVSQCPKCQQDRGVPAYMRNHGLQRRYGISQEEYQQMFESQDGVCAICGGVEDGGRPLHVDHDHATGAIRGLLCRQCNHGLGNFQDQITLLENAKTYLATRK